MYHRLISDIGCIGFRKPVHCVVIGVAVVFNILLRGIRNARNYANAHPSILASFISNDTSSSDIPLKPTCSYVVLIALHSLAACYFANQLTMLRRQTAIAKCVCILHFSASMLTFFSGLITLLQITDDEDLLTVFAESLCFLVLVSDFAKPLRIVSKAMQSDRATLSFNYISVLSESFVDLLMQLLIISLGALFRLPAVLRACSYAALGLTSTFLSFYLIVPAIIYIAMCLDIKYDGISQKKFNKTEGVALGSHQSTSKEIPPFSSKKLADANPLARRVKFIMSAAILLVHAHSKLKPSTFGSPTSARSASNSQTTTQNNSFDRNPHLVQSATRSDDWSDFDEVSAADWGLTLVLAVVICLRFLLFSDSAEQPPLPQQAAHFEMDNSEDDEKSELNLAPASTSTPVLDSHRPKSLAVNRKSPKLTHSASTVQFRPARQRLISDSTLIAKSDEELIDYYISNNLPLYSLETKLMSHESGRELGACRAVAIRRGILSKRHPEIADAVKNVPFAHYGEFANVVGACCENVIGTIPLPVGLAGPLLIDDVDYMVPMATTEGCLVASVNRGCKVLTTAGGVKTVLLNDGMSRAPVVRMPDVTAAAELRSWLKDPANFDSIAEIFNGTSRFCRLSAIEPFQAGAYVYIRFVAQTGDAMGMNMVSRACESAISFIIGKFPSCRLLSLSGNACADKKSAAVNWLMGRGKSVISEAIIPREVVCDQLRTTPEALVRLNTAKNLIGSAVAGAVAGGFNAHAANILAALYIATGQDVAQVVESSACLTILEVTGDTPTTSVSEEPHGGDLHITCTLPTVEVGTVGGGTILGPQKSCLSILGVAGSASIDEGQQAGDNARKLARIAAAAVLAGELSLLAALATNQLMPAHLRLNRSQLNMVASQPNLPESAKEEKCCSSDC